MYKKISLLYLFSLVLFINTKAQDCAVGLESLKGKYEGGCKQGKADGKGKATGIDMYEGEFKNGLPEGTGRYTWKNGNYYDGNWLHGKRDGHGVMVYKLTDADSLVSGFWNKDVFTGKYEKPFIVHSKTKHVTQFTCRKENALSNQLDISLSSASGGNGSSISTINPDKTPRTDEGDAPILPLVAKPEITSIQVTEGEFSRKTENSNYGKKIVYTIEEVKFPFRAQINIGNEFIDVEFFEAGRWSVEITLAY